MAVKTYHVDVTFTEHMLGTVTKNKDVYADYIASKAPEGTKTDDEIETVQEMEEKGWTGFHMDEKGNPLIYDYTWKGFFKESASFMKRVGDTRSAKLTAFKKIIDGLVFVGPRRIPLIIPEGETMGVLERPLRAQTAQGERVALARSDTVPPGTKCSFEVRVLGDTVTEDILREWLDYGALHGFGQWRNGGWGVFSYTLTAK